MRSWLSEALPVTYLNRIACFETLRAYAGKVFHVTEHLRRLEDSCAALGFICPLSSKEMAAWLLESIVQSEYPDALLRVAVHALGDGSGEIVLSVRPFSAHPREWYENGVRIETAVMRRWTINAQDPQIKASQYVPGVLAYLDKGERQAHELVFLGPGETVAEGSVSNLFTVKAKRILTPPVSSGILRGVTRAFVIKTARAGGFDVVERPLTRHEFYVADECFMTNTSSEILPVASMDGRMIGDGRPGPVTRKLAADFSKAILEVLNDQD